LKSDEQLVAEAKQGSNDAFGEVVERYQGKLLRFLMTRCNSRSDAEDALQDSFISAYRYLHSYNPKWRFSTWLYRIAIRNAARQPIDAAVPLGDPATDGDDPLRECIVRSERENLWLTAKRLLPDDGYNALWLHYVEDLPVREVATVLDRSVPWTKVNLMRCRRKMQKALGDRQLPRRKGELYG
jgi:RNA polymerase sigma-70 factor (ECF subfamily)